MAQRIVKLGTIKDGSGEVNSAGGDIYRGFTAKQVSVLHAQITSTFPTNSFDWRRPYKGLDAFELAVNNCSVKSVDLEQFHRGNVYSGSILDPAQPAASAFGVTHND